MDIKKKILIYGLGKSGLSSYKFLKKKADVYLFDDNSKINKKLVSLSKISKISIKFASVRGHLVISFDQNLFIFNKFLLDK